MSRVPVAVRSLLDLRWTIFWYGIGLGLYGALVMWLFPAFEDTLRQIEYPEEMLAFFGGTADLAHPAVYITTQYQSFAPLVLMIYALVASTGMLAGEEGRGTLESQLAQPVARRRLIIEKAAAFLAGAGLICAVSSIAWLASVPFIELDGELTLAMMAGATLAMLPVVAFFGALGFLFGALAPSRGQAAGILVTLAIASYLVASFAQAIEPVAWMRYLSPYYYSDAHRILVEGVVWEHQAGLVVAAVVVFALAVRTFEGREIAAGTWQPRALVRGLSDVRAAI